MVSMMVLMLIISFLASRDARVADWTGHCDVSMPHYRIMGLGLDRCWNVGKPPFQYNLCCRRGNDVPECRIRDLPRNKAAPQNSNYPGLQLATEPPQRVEHCFIHPPERKCYWNVITDAGKRSKDVMPGDCQGIPGKHGKVWFACCGTQGSTQESSILPLKCWMQEKWSKHPAESFRSTVRRYKSVPDTPYSIDASTPWTQGIYCYELDP